MKQYFIDNHSNKLILFFAGWGCDEYEFEHLMTDCDVLIFYDYTDLEYNFDFSKYLEINILSFSAGVFVGSVFKYNFNVNKKIAMSGNPYLFDEKLGLSESMQKTLFELTEDNCEEFAKNYLVKTNEEYLNFHNAKRTIESCKKEFTALKNIYIQEYKNIKDNYDIAIIGAEDPIFNPDSQKEYYSERLRIIDNARHNLFFRIKSYNEIFNLCIE